MKQILLAACLFLPVVSHAFTMAENYAWICQGFPDVRLEEINRSEQLALLKTSAPSFMNSQNTSRLLEIVRSAPDAERPGFDLLVMNAALKILVAGGYAQIAQELSQLLDSPIPDVSQLAANNLRASGLPLAAARLEGIAISRVSLLTQDSDDQTPQWFSYVRNALYATEPSQREALLQRFISLMRTVVSGSQADSLESTLRSTKRWVDHPE